MLLWSVAGHHPEVASPDLLEWIKARLDELLSLGPWTVVILLGLLVVAIPLAIVLLYATQRRRGGSGTQQTRSGTVITVAGRWVGANRQDRGK